MEDVSAPLLHKAEVRRGEPPATLPLPEYDAHVPKKVVPPEPSIPDNLPFA